MKKLLWLKNAQYMGAVIANFYLITLMFAAECSKSYRHRMHFTAARFVTIQSRRGPATRRWPHGGAPRRSARQLLRWSRSGHLSCHAQGYSTRRRDAALPHALCPARRRCDLRVVADLLNQQFHGLCCGRKLKSKKKNQHWFSAGCGCVVVEFHKIRYSYKDFSLVAAKNLFHSAKYSFSVSL